MSTNCPYWRVSAVILWEVWIADPSQEAELKPLADLYETTKNRCTLLEALNHYPEDTLKKVRHVFLTYRNELYARLDQDSDDDEDAEDIPSMNGGIEVIDEVLKTRETAS